MRFSKVLSLLTALLATSSLSQVTRSATVTEENSTVLPEMKLIEGLSNPDKSFAFFNLTVSDNSYVRSGAHLAINAYAKSYGSDPDIFVSKRQHVDRIEDADWHSTREGSDTKIIHSDDFAPEDTLFITIHCMNECTYDLKAYYAREFELENNERMTYRWGGHVTNILKYRIPEVTSSGETEKFEILIEPEVDYKYLEVYLSHDLDGKFSVIEDRPVRHITDEGFSVYMTRQDSRWCVNCDVYLIINMEEDRRIYVTATAMTYNPGLIQGVNHGLFANEGQIECESYSIGSSTYDALFHFDSFQGEADFFLAKRTQPNSIKSSSVVVTTKISHPQQVLIAKQVDREYWAAQLGVYYFCAQAYDALSSSLKVTEGNWQGKISSEFDQVYNFILQSESAQQFKLRDDDLFTQTAVIRLDAAVYTTGNGDLNDLAIYYKLCTDNEGNCFFTDEEAIGVGAVERLEVEKSQTQTGDFTQEAVDTSFDYVGYILHHPSECNGATRCQYIVSVANPSPLETPRQVTFKAEIRTDQIEDITPGQPYKNTVRKGQYVNYRILDSQFDLDNIYEITMDLRTFLGDADLYVSTTYEISRPNTTHFDYASRHNDQFDQIVITDSVNEWLPTYIYIAVYGNLYSEFELNLSVKEHPTYNTKLNEAVNLHENVSVYREYENESGSSFFSYRPWWSMHEQKSIVMLADSPQQEVTFYLQVDDYPKIYETTWIDENEIFALHPSDEGYKNAVGLFGTYYVRVRPSYTLADLLVDGKYSYYFRAFSQPAGDGLTDIHQNSDLVGVAYAGQNSYYRHFLTVREHTIRVTLERLAGKGLPKLMVKFANSRINPESSLPNSYDKKAESTLDTYSVHIDMHAEWRATQGHPDCDFAGYWQNGGSELCTLYIGVECAEDEPLCAYKISLQLFEGTEDPEELGPEVLTRQPARYITKDQDYNDMIPVFQQHTRFYYPILPEESGDILIFANKTAPIGRGTPITLLVNVEPNSTVNYAQWTYAWNYRGYFLDFSRTGEAIQPEMIELSQSQLEELCEEDCSLQITVYGEGEDEEDDSIVRMRVFNGTNKLYPEKPIHGVHSGKGTFKYYWFKSDGAKDAQVTGEFWQHTISMGIKTQGADFDLFVSVMDGRYPTADDFDFKSTNFGSDLIQLFADDPMFQHSNEDSWDPSVGMVVVVGVQALSDEEAEFSLVMNGPNDVVYDITEVITSESIITAVEADPTRSTENPYIKVYKWYNWGHNNLKIDVKALSGAAKIFLNAVSETKYLDNAYSAIGRNADNSAWQASLNASSVGEDVAELVLTRSDTESYPYFCYNCFYYITVIVDTPEETEYRLWCQALRDNGSELTEIAVQSITGFDLTDSGDKSKAKFLLSSKDSFELEINVDAGQARVSISNDPDLVDFDPIWSLSQPEGQGFIEVSTDDANFHIATWFFITIQQVGDTATRGTIELSQQRQVDYLANGVAMKMQFIYEREIVKHAVFTVPNSWSFHSATQIEIEKLESLVYPAIYLKKIEMSTQPASLEDLEYPSLIDYDIKFGYDFENLFGEDKAQYTLQTQSESAYTFYTMAIYQNSYGMTDKRKPEFKLTVTSIEYLSETTPIVAQASPTSSVVAESEEVSSERRLAGTQPVKMGEKLNKALEFFQL